MSYKIPATGEPCQGKIRAGEELQQEKIDFIEDYCNREKEISV